jgi:hypothetical protein
MLKLTIKRFFSLKKQNGLLERHNNHIIHIDICLVVDKTFYKSTSTVQHCVKDYIIEITRCIFSINNFVD